MKTAQRSLDSLILYNKSDEECAQFLGRYHEVIKDYLLVFTQSISLEIERLLESLDLRLYISLKQSSHNLVRDIVHSEAKLDSKNDDFLHFNRTIRSGEELESPRSIMISGNVNDGAVIFVKKDLIIVGDNHGRIDCSGKLLALRKTSKPVIFQGQILDFGDLGEQSDALKFIYKQGDEVQILEFKG